MRAPREGERILREMFANKRCENYNAILLGVKQLAVA